MPPSSISQLDTFHPFPRLPLEIRDEIWSLSLPAPRLIHVQTERGEIRLPGRQPNQPFAHVWAQKLPVPSILHVCNDARAVGLKHYELVFDTNCRPAKEDLPALRDLPATRGGSQLIFPFEKKNMIYVDLERDFIITRHRRFGYRAPPGGWPKDEMADPRFAAWPVQKGRFKIETFREAIPEEVYTRIKNFVARIVFSLDEIFNRRYGIGMGCERGLLAIRDPFSRVDGGQFRIDVMGSFYGGKVSMARKGRVRSILNLEELQRAADEETVWDWVVDKKQDEMMMAEKKAS
ncbi:hypothetical protein BKA61DRAFT_729957 [Leptodontidium sp. MPI-SDFR-AT-0119]|nr:hypothetical protein BKA61DRAFT_729957 [Leptodontidium sp. MPI-SDFR-AT-0119]